MNQLEKAKDISLSKFKAVQTVLKRLIDQTESIHTCGFCKEYIICHLCEGQVECDKMKRFVLEPLHSIEDYLKEHLIPYLSPDKPDEP